MSHKIVGSSKKSIIVKSWKTGNDAYQMILIKHIEHKIFVIAWRKGIAAAIKSLRIANRITTQVNWLMFNDAFCEFSIVKHILF